jgi:Tol biopolymer transport system component/DNA-binding winged helix-turn-helix (wHTH) protein
METPTRKLYLFDDFCLDATECQLSRRGEVIALPPKVFDTLRVMVEHRGRILDKEFLMKSLWPDTFVEDGTLAQYVFLLRKALHEESAQHRYIETIPRRGYRFVAQVQEVSGDQSSESNPSTSAFFKTNGNHETNGAVITRPLPPTPASKANFLHPIAIIAILLVAGFIAAYFFVRRTDQPSVINQTRQITRLTASGKAGLPVLSPDGKYVAYRVDEAGKQSVWMRQIAAVNSVQIVPPAEVELSGLNISPDGNYLFYTMHQRPPVYGALYRVPVLGGGAVKLIDDIDSAITFSPDGKQIAFVRLAPLESESSIILANADGSQQQKLATRKLPEYFHHSEGLAWSPDGKLIACPAGSSGANGPFMNLIGVDVSTGQQTLLTSQEWRRTGQIAWRKDGSGLVAIAWNKDSPLASEQLWWFPYPKGEPRKITNDLNVYNGISLSQDSRQLVTVQSTKVANLWIVPEADASRARQIGGQSIDNHAHRLGLTWSPTGKLIYGSYASGNADLWQMDADGANQQQLTTTPNFDLAPAVSADGRQIAFVSDRAGGFRIWRMDADGLNATRLTDGQADHFPTFTPDGQSVFFTASIHEQPTVWKVPVTGGAPVQFTPHIAFGPAVSPDGKWVALFIAMPQSLLYKLAILPITGGEPVRIFETVPSEVPIVRWSQDGRLLTYVETKQGVSNIWGQPMEGGAARQLTDFKTDRIFRFAWSPDGKTLLCERGFYVNDVVLMSDFLPS